MVKKTVFHFHFLQLLLSEDLNTIIGNGEIQNKIGGFGEPFTNTSGLKVTDFAAYNNMKIMNSLCKHKCIPTYTWSVCSSKTVTDYFTVNRKLSEPFLDWESTEEVILVQITFWLWVNYDFHQLCYIYPRTLQVKKIYFIIKLDYSMTEVYDGYTNKELNRKYKKSPRK